MKRSTLILSCLLALGLAASCVKQSLQSTYDKQTSYIDNFVATQMKADSTATLVRNGGSYRLTLADTLDRVFGERDSLKEGQRVSLWYACFTLTGNSISTSNLVATNVIEVAEMAKWKLTDSTNIFHLDTIRVDKKLVEGLYLGLQGVQQFDHGYVLFTGEYGFGNMARGTIPARSALVYQYVIDEIFDD